MTDNQDISLAEQCYRDYCAATGGKSAATGDPLPAFSDCSEAVKLGWHAVAIGHWLRSSMPFPSAPADLDPAKVAEVEQVIAQDAGFGISPPPKPQK